jgi:hypothetical protein
MTLVKRLAFQQVAGALVTRVSPWAEYGDDVCGKGRGEEERHDADGEAHARVVEQRHPSI